MKCVYLLSIYNLPFLLLICNQCAIVFIWRIMVLLMNQLKCFGCDATSALFHPIHIHFIHILFTFTLHPSHLSRSKPNADAVMWFYHFILATLNHLLFRRFYQNGIQWPALLFTSYSGNKKKKESRVKESPHKSVHGFTIKSQHSALR